MSVLGEVVGGCEFDGASCILLDIPALELVEDVAHPFDASPVLYPVPVLIAFRRNDMKVEVLGVPVDVEDGRAAGESHLVEQFHRCCPQLFLGVLMSAAADGEVKLEQLGK